MKVTLNYSMAWISEMQEHGVRFYLTFLSSLCVQLTLCIVGGIVSGYVPASGRSLNEDEDQEDCEGGITSSFLL